MDTKNKRKQAKSLPILQKLQVGNPKSDWRKKFKKEVKRLRRKYLKELEKAINDALDGK